MGSRRRTEEQQGLMSAHFIVKLGRGGIDMEAKDSWLEVGQITECFRSHRKNICKRRERDPVCQIK